MKLILFAASIFALSCPAMAKDFTASENGLIDFDTPSLNMCCTFVPKDNGKSHLACSRVAPKYWTVDLDQDGKVIHYKNPGEVPGCGYGQPIGNVLNYGETWTKAGFSCSSSKSGLTCKKGLKGFSLSRRGLKKF